MSSNCPLVIYHNERDDGVVHDFPKGKADEDETEVECAIREIKEEVGLNVRPQINEE